MWVFEKWVFSKNPLLLLSRSGIFKWVFKSGICRKLWPKFHWLHTWNIGSFKKSCRLTSMWPTFCHSATDFFGKLAKCIQHNKAMGIKACTIYYCKAQRGPKLVRLPMGPLIEPIAASWYDFCHIKNMKISPSPMIEREKMEWMNLFYLFVSLCSGQIGIVLHMSRTLWGHS